MLGHLSARVNGWIARLFSEKRLIIRSETSARYLRISPLAQLGAAVFALSAIAWFGYSSLSLARSGAAVAAAETQRHDAERRYEARLRILRSRAAQAADLASRSDLRSARAMAELTRQHITLSNAVSTERKLASALQSHRSRLEALSGEHDATLKMCEASANRVAALESELLTFERENSALGDALAALNQTLDNVATERDAASESQVALTMRLDELSTEISEGAERRSRVFSQLEDAAAISLGSLEGVFAKSGVKLEPILSAVRREYDGEGGPFLPADQIGAISAGVAKADRLADLMRDLERINALRIATERLPFARPARAARFTSGFGPRRDPKSGKRAMHTGLDLAGPRGTPIYATGAGTIVKASRMRGYGKVVKIRHAFGYETVYAHLHRIRVKVGDAVERGDRIGDMGSTGRSTGTHLHYEVRIGGEPVNPAKYIEAARNVL